MVVKVCCICESESTKYKCPKCRKFYCSITCCNKHKEQCSETMESPSYEVDQKPLEEKPIEYNFCSEDTVPLDKLEQLRYCEEVKNCLKNPQVRDIISSVLQDADPTEAIAKAMTEPVFVEFADECLKVVEMPDDEKPC